MRGHFEATSNVRWAGASLGRQHLPYSLDQLPDSLGLLKIPDGLDDSRKQQAERQARQRPQILTFVVEDAETIERAFKEAKRGQELVTRGAALVAIARAYVADKEAER